MRDRRADVLLNSLFVNHRSIRQLAESLDVVLVDIDADAAATVTKDWNIGTYTIGNDAYGWSAGDVTTPTLSAQLFVRADADPKMVGDITAALVNNIDLVRGVHKAMKPLSVDLMGGSKQSLTILRQRWPTSDFVNAQNIGLACIGQAFFTMKF